jgi:hypothetical protein
MHHHLVTDLATQGRRAQVEEHAMNATTLRRPPADANDFLFSSLYVRAAIGLALSVIALWGYWWIQMHG